MVLNSLPRYLTKKKMTEASASLINRLRNGGRQKAFIKMSQSYREKNN